MDAPIPTANATAIRLLTAAEALVVGEGVHALSVRRIAQAAEVNSALIRYHFGSVDGLLRDLALRNAARIADRRNWLLEAAGDSPGFEAAVDALALPLWSEAAMAPHYRAIVVLDEIFARASRELHEAIWQVFAEGVARVTAALQAALPATDAATLGWRIRFVTAAALDVPPRASREAPTPGGARVADDAQRLEQFRHFACHALRA